MQDPSVILMMVLLDIRELRAHAQGELDPVLPELQRIVDSTARPTPEEVTKIIRGKELFAKLDAYNEIFGSINTHLKD